MKEKFLKIVIIMTMIVITFATIVNAYSFTATMETNMTTIPEATEFTVTVKVSNLDVGPNGISGLSGYIKYNKDVFETINESSIEGINGWNAQYASDSSKVTLTKTTFVKSEESVFNITFKTKTGVNGKEGLIQFNNIIATNNDSDISTSDISTTIVVGTVSGNIANKTGNIAGNTLRLNATSNKSNTSNISNVTNTSNKVNNTGTSFVNKTNTTDDDIPYTGVEDSLPFLMIGIVLLAIVFYIKIERINKELK